MTETVIHLQASRYQAGWLQYQQSSFWIAREINLDEVRAGNKMTPANNAVRKIALGSVFPYLWFLQPVSLMSQIR